MSLVRISLAEMSLMGTVMILVILLLRALLRKRLRASIWMLLWYAAVLRLLVPVSVAVLSGTQAWLAEICSLKAARTIVENTISRTLAESQGIWVIRLDSENWSLLNLNGAVEAVGGDKNRLVFLVSVLWMAGALVSATYFGISYLRGRRIFREALPVEDERMEMVLAQLKLVRKIQIRSLDRIESPLTYGIWKPVILLPKSLVTGNQEQEERDGLLQCILLHEGMHIRHWDAWMKLMLAAVLVLHWFNPCVWLLYLFANRDMELCCDEAVVRRLGENKRSFYASALLYMEEVRCESAVGYPCFNRNILEERIRRIMEKKKITKLTTGLGSMAVLAVCLIFALSAGTSNAVTHNALENTENTSTAVKNQDITSESIPVSEEASQEEKIIGVSRETEYFLVWPVENCKVVTSAFGNRVHPITGEVQEKDHITISGEAGSNSQGALIYAVDEGVVKETGFDVEKGNYIVLEHADGLSSMYTHCETLKVENGEYVLQGDVIATMGQTGTVTGACLGFYIYQDGEARDPLNYYPQ